MCSCVVSTLPLDSTVLSSFCRLVVVTDYRVRGPSVELKRARFHLFSAVRLPRECVAALLTVSLPCSVLWITVPWTITDCFSDYFNIVSAARLLLLSDRLFAIHEGVFCTF